MTEQMRSSNRNKHNFNDLNISRFGREVLQVEIRSENLITCDVLVLDTCVVFHNSNAASTTDETTCRQNNHLTRVRK